MTELKYYTINDIINNNTRQFPKRSAIEYPGGKVTYAELDALTSDIAAGLLSQGIGRGSHVAVWTKLSEISLLYFLAVQRIGAVAVMVHSGMPVESMERIVLRTDSSWMIVDGERHLSASISLKDAGHIKGVICVSEENARCVSHSGIIEKSVSVSSEEREKAFCSVTPEDDAVMLTTSGTTGVPKVVVSSQYSRVNNGIQQACDMRATENDRFCLVLPIFHCFCLSANIYAALSAGACLYIPEDRHTMSIIKAFRYGKCTILNAVPTQFRTLIESPELKENDFETLRVGIIGGGGYPPALFKKINNVLSFTLLSSLGMTEGTAGFTVCNIDDDLETRANTVGHFMSHIEGKIIDMETGNEVPAGQIGEICFRGYNVMKCYYKDPELTEKTIDSEGFLHSGDIGYIDSDGNVHLVGRAKDIIIRGGENICPIDVEVAILETPNVYACKVVGVPDEYFGEKVCALIVPEYGKDVDIESLPEILRTKLEKRMIPEYIFRVESFPINEIGKIDGVKLKELAAQLAGKNS